jgi:hypothetical protein
VAAFRSPRRLQALYTAAARNATGSASPCRASTSSSSSTARTRSRGLRRSLRIVEQSRTEDRARVGVGFRNFGPQSLIYDLVLENGRWVIDEVTSRGRGRLGSVRALPSRRSGTLTATLNPPMTHTRRFLLVLLAAIVPAPLSAQGAREPIDVVRRLYAPQTSNSPPNYPFSRRLQALHDAAIARSRALAEPVAGIDFAFEVNGQDEEPGTRRGARFAELSRNAGRSRVRVTFRNGGPARADLRARARGRRMAHRRGRLPPGRALGAIGPLPTGRRHGAVSARAAGCNLRRPLRFPPPFQPLFSGVDHPRDGQAGAFPSERLGPTTRRKTKRPNSMTKWVYTFGDGKAEGEAGMKNLLGGKGANLAEMSNLGLPVPPGFTITTEVCTWYYDNGKQFPPELDSAGRQAALAAVAASPARPSATRESAARLGPLRRPRLDAGHDGHRPQSRPQRRTVEASPGLRRCPLRLRQLSPLHHHVFERRARYRPSPFRGSATDDYKDAQGPPCSTPTSPPTTGR